MNRLLTAIVSLVPLATIACSASYQQSDPDVFGAESPVKGDEGADSSGTAKSSQGGSGLDTDTNESGSKLIDPPSLADGAVETVSAKCRSSNGVQGNGDVTRASREASGFVDVVMKLPGRLVIQEGSKFRVQVEADSNVQDLVSIGVEEDALLIGSTGSFCANRLNVVVTMPRFHGALLRSSGAVEITKQTAASAVALGLEGSGALTFRGLADALTIDLSGSGAIVLDSGGATSTTVDLSGSGNVRGKSFSAGRLTKNVSGSGAVML